ncbi:hypothetical protein D0469_06955 [Peribacillus saganii]|uniref:Uncharacterized protein n=1 Tax=Peribacillus saganii TaxID=2303992 RepID=A0A372LRC3_9BACI|nr:hypothetical protein [Peribacillus saganii]RFU70332.1 hypothetical protein D0469_06955 [Peribacillus saganii]
MEILIGLITGLVLFAVLALGFFIGYKFTNKHKATSLEPVSEEAKRKAEEIQKHFSNLMNYDVATAYQRKKVD